jgi:phosphatidylinositol glycan class C protein
MIDLSRTVMWLFFVILSFVTLIAPAVLIWGQRYKKSVHRPDLDILLTSYFSIIRGPWDVAVPKVND